MKFRKWMVIALCIMLAMSNVKAIPAFASDEDAGQEEVGSGFQDDGGSDEGNNDSQPEPPNEEPPKEEPPKEEPPSEKPPKEEPKKKEPVVEQPQQEQPNQQDSNDQQGDQNQNNQDQGDQNQNDQGQITEIRELDLSENNISFGTIVKGDMIEPIEVTLYNDGNTDVRVKWIQSDTNDIFRLTDMSDSNKTLGPGDERVYQISLNEKVMKQGDYSGSFIFQDEDVPDSQVLLAVSVRILENDNTPAPDPEKDPQEENTEESTEEKKEEENTSEDKTKFTIKGACQPSKAGYVSGGGTFDKGSKTVLTVYANDGYTFKGWYQGSKQVSKNASYAINDIKENLSLVAMFSYKDCKIVVKSSNTKYGTVSGGGWFSKGENTVIKAEPKKGYIFGGWYENKKLVSKKSSYTVKNIQKDHKYKAVFRKGEHSVSVSVEPKGAGTVTGAGTYKDNSDVQITAKAKKGYVFKRFTLNNQTVTVKDKFKVKHVDRDLSFTACFEDEYAETYQMVSGVANDGGIIIPSGKLDICARGDVTYTFAPDKGFAVQEVAVDGKKIGAVKSYTFKDIKENHTITVAFAPKKGNVSHAKKSKIISTKEAAKYAVAELVPAAEGTEGKSSGIITPEMYKKMKEEGTLEEALKIPDQSVVGMDDTEGLPDEVDGYNYDSAKGLYQALDITPEEAKKMIDEGKDEKIIKTAYEEGYLDILINNQYLVPGKEEKTDDVFEDDSTVKNMLEFVNCALNADEKMGLFDGKKMTISVAITNGDDLSGDEKAELEKAGAKIDEYFYMTVMKTQGNGEPQLVTELERPLEVVLKVPDNSGANCIVRLHNKKAEILEDLDDSPDTITIKTDRFSPYAFATEQEAAGLPIPVIGGIIVAAFAVITGIFVATGKKKKRRA